MKKILLLALAVVLVFSMSGSQVAPVKPEETQIYSKIIETRNNGKLLETAFYLVKEPQAGKTAKPNDVVARLFLTPERGKNFHLDVLRVNKEYRERLGYGDLLFNLMKEYLRHYGVEKLLWTADPFELKPGQKAVDMLPKLIGFYEKQGGKVVRQSAQSSVSEMLGLRPLSVLMELDLSPLGKLRQPWLPESLNELPQGSSRKNIEIISTPHFIGVKNDEATQKALDEATQKALANSAPFVIINFEPQMVKKFIKSRL